MGTRDPGRCCLMEMERRPAHERSSTTVYHKMGASHSSSPADPAPWIRVKASPQLHAGCPSTQGRRSRAWPPVPGCLPDLTSLWRKRQLLRRLAELPRQQVTSPYSCMIFIISHMAVDSKSHESGRWSPVQVPVETHRPKPQGSTHGGAP